MDTTKCTKRHTQYILDLKDREIAQKLSPVLNNYLIGKNLFILGNSKWVYSIIDPATDFIYNSVCILRLKI